MFRIKRFIGCATAVFSTTVAAQASEPYKIGYLVDASGPMQGIFNQGLEGFQLYIDSVNASGGINGHKIEVMIRDVQIDPARSASSAQELAGEGALAIAGLSLTDRKSPRLNSRP